MIKLFESTDTDFYNNGIKVIGEDFIEYCDITLKDNSDYYVEIRTKDLTYQSDLKVGRIIYITDLKYVNTECEAFRITEINYIDDFIDIKGLQLYYDTQNYICGKVEIMNQTANVVMNNLSIAPNNVPFRFSSNLNKTATYKLKDMSLDEALSEIQKQHGGHLYRNLFNIFLYDKIGEETEIRLEIGKNVKGYKKEENWSNVVTHLLPVSDYKEGTYLSDIESERWIVSKEQYNIPYYKTVEFNVTDSFVEGVEEDDPRYLELVRSDLRRQAENYLEQNKVPQFKYEIDVASLKQDIHLGDSLICFIPQIGENNLYAEITEIEYDCIGKEYKTVTIGNYVSSKPSDILDNIVNNNTGFVNQISTINKSLSDNVTSVTQLNLDITDMTTVRSYKIELGEYCGAKYNSTVQRIGNTVDLDLDITFSKTINANQKACVLILPSEVIPNVYLASNCTTNKEVVGGRFSVESDGRVYWFAGSKSLVYSASSPDGFRTHLSYSVRR